MNEAHPPRFWLEKAEHDIAQCTGDIADLKRELTHKAIDEMCRQTVQGAHVVLERCADDVRSIRSDPRHTAKVLAENENKKLRKACQRVYQKANGAIVFLKYKTVLHDCNDGDHHDGDDGIDQGSTQSPIFLDPDS
jgi:hypothetical protein